MWKEEVMKLHGRDSINGSLQHLGGKRTENKVHLHYIENNVFILFFFIQANKCWGYCFPVLAFNILNMFGSWGR